MGKTNGTRSALWLLCGGVALRSNVEAIDIKTLGLNLCFLAIDTCKSEDLRPAFIKILVSIFFVLI
jgi:hypothetical protein